MKIEDSEGFFWILHVWQFDIRDILALMHSIRSQMIFPLGGNDFRFVVHRCRNLGLGLVLRLQSRRFTFFCHQARLRQAPRWSIKSSGTFNVDAAIRRIDLHIRQVLRVRYSTRCSETISKKLKEQQPTSAYHPETNTRPPQRWTVGRDAGVSHPSLTSFSRLM